MGVAAYTLFLSTYGDAFDMVPRTKLWQALSDMDVPSDVLDIIKRLHIDTFAQVCWCLDGLVTKRIDVKKIATDVFELPLVFFFSLMGAQF